MLVTNAEVALANGYGRYGSDEGTLLSTGCELRPAREPHFDMLDIAESYPKDKKIWGQLMGQQKANKWRIHRFVVAGSATK